MFTPETRSAVRESLVARARHDPCVAGAALVGSAATGREDSWSDIDLALQVSRGHDPAHVAADWTTWLCSEAEVADTLDVVAGGTLFRVFLLADSLQIDLSFWRFDTFRATQDGFTVLFGAPNEPSTPRPFDAAHHIGMGWLYALHARSALARGKLWQTLMMLDGIRDQIVMLACERYGLDPHHGRDVDLLPAGELTALGAARATTLDPAELHRSKAAMITLLRAEVVRHDATLAQRLAPPLSIIGAASIP
ncbi:nucleotidyltransferase domain-containing protein [Isoptericola croceus]|uniref:nucleotidyltransferase domain-containing protein n=1 Tax=Isoptericola croceus TaxID=3031406 RepID=UPI0023F71900|nr:nucleotidyltransferase domain-containing protein [Isoptericola croceus]